MKVVSRKELGPRQVFDIEVDQVHNFYADGINVHNCATNGGVSVIKHNGTVVNSASTIGFEDITIDKDMLGIADNASSTWFYAAKPGLLGASFVLSTMAGNAAPGFGVAAILGLKRKNRGEYLRRGGTRVNFLKQHENIAAASISGEVTNTYNTGMLTGDIRRAYLADVDVGSASGPELVTNGTFDTDTSGWIPSTANVTAVRNVSGQLEVTNNGAGYVTQTINTVAGKTYRVQVNWSQKTGGGRFNIGTTVGGTNLLIVTNPGNYSGLTFTASGATAVISLGDSGSGAGTTQIYDNISVQEAVADRSYKAQGASITGSLVKSQVASAAQLVAYSGFSASNYLREPYSADLDFGTGEWSVGAWVNVPLDLATASWPSLGNELNTFTAFQNWTPQGTGVSIDAGTGVLTLINPSSTVPVYRSLLSTVGKAYTVTVTIDSVSGGAIRLSHSGGGQTVGEITAPGTYTFTFTRTGGDGGLGLRSTSTSLNAVVSAISVKEVAGTLTITDRAHSSGASIKVGVINGGYLTATAFDGTTTRTITTTAAYNTATWLKAEAQYKTDGSLGIVVNGQEVAVTRGNPLLTLNNGNAVLTIGNSFAADAPFPGSIALLKASATVPTAEQSVWMYEQEKQMFRDGAQVTLPDAGSIVDLTYDDLTDKWIAVSATNESEWSGLVRTSVTPSPAGSYSKITATSGVQLQARSTTSPGVDITMPAQNLREELLKDGESSAKLNAQLAVFDYVGGFTANTTSGSTSIASVAGLVYPVSYIGARISGAGIPANTTIVGVSGTTLYLSAAATATASTVQISFFDFVLPVGLEAKAVLSAGAAKVEGSTKDFTRLFDGFKETIRFGTVPGYNVAVQIQAARSAA